jgi:hypothetical protein
MAILVMVNSIICVKIASASLDLLYAPSNDFALELNSLPTRW